MTLRSDAAALLDDLVALRRDLHKIPEIGLHLPRTQERVLAALDGLPLELTLGKNLSSITAVLRGGKPGGTVLLRGDMDALPVTEASGEEFTSTLDGAMHACGHDLHTAGLVGAARLLAARRQDLPGDVVFMFQPGEEGWDGAGHMIDEGVLTASGKQADAAYGLHVSAASYAKGQFTARPGTLMAASGALEVRVKGDGGHGSSPHDARDPIPAACEMVTALQTMVTRTFDVFDPVVITVGSFHAGTRRNIIPDDAVFEATLRSFSPEVAARVGERAVQVCRGIAQAHGLDIDVTYEPEYPATVNDAAAYDFVADTVRDVFGEERFTEMADPITGSEDFSRVLDRVPGAYLFLGACPTDPATAPDNHSPRARFDDSVLGDGAALLAELAVRRLGSLAG
ncbi:M20 metallopeptidase family protein [Amycolatopsis vancoresmycina]|uniref:Metal-dependent amidase/aminoacylase/carboxypeptidase n=1 Tax=Amycolatopsis vancoresmycina DSM 44592 TaxID=1292037 RepID=R1HM26_9PSEU|nr:M20 family metallopeptidase [Amycolatopsis vancoresmycina]EOD61431.1 metal-dependent amidase/aminoacylase/carboxypeptidase [Amycolatopsis vancoresmycina DSM 44592]